MRVRGEDDQPVQHLKQHGCAALSVEFPDGLRRHHACSGEEFRVLLVLETLWFLHRMPAHEL